MKIFFAITILSLFTASALGARNNTAKYWKCNNKVGGTWTFGTAPKACSVDAFMSERLADQKYKTYIFNERNNSYTERERYVTEMIHLVEQAADYYLKKRKPSATTEEKKWWRRAVLAITHQESFMTHYRKGSDSKLRMMRGDFGHGHGLMQVDDRWHFAAVNKGRAANLIDNLFYALDIYYNAWQKAPSQSCVASKTSYYNRARAAYGGYNGGLGAMCRFTNPNHKWARNDKNFKDKFDGQTWARYQSSLRKPTSVDVACLLNSGSSCKTTKPINPELKKVQNFRDNLCAIKDNKYFCITNPAKRFCLVKTYQLINEVIKTTVVRPVVFLTDNQACGIEEEEEEEEEPPKSNAVLEVGSFIEVTNNIHLRATPGGLKKSIVRTGETYQVLGSHIVPERNNGRYYLVDRNGVRGYFFAGTNADYKKWAILSDHASKVILPTADSFVSIQTRSGTNLRSTPAGKRISVVPSKQTVKVLSTRFIKSTKKFYIEVEYKGKRGFLYSGQIHPKFSVYDWVRLK